MPPFVVFSLPRSRSHWLSRYLSYGDWTCGHEELRYLRGLNDIKSWLSQDCTGTAETAAAPWWRLLMRYRPDTNVIVVRRLVNEVVESMMALGVGFDRESLTRQLRRLDAKLDQIERRMPNVFSVKFSELDQEWTCAAVFEHCLPYKHDREWWRRFAAVNLQCSVPALMRYYSANQPQLEKLAKIAKQSILQELAAKPVATHDGITIQVEPFDPFFRDAQALITEHLIEIGEPPDAILGKNTELMRQFDRVGSMQIITARCNGRMFGYLMTIIGPSFEHSGEMAVHTANFASPQFPGLGLKLERTALNKLRDRGVCDVSMRAGVRGSGPKMGALYRRVGGIEDGTLFRIPLREMN